ncbi:hypothetical protein COCCADRAFT_1068 [Bipolaris zeicola 26-R-13]|uniref:Ubiquitin 3 binding protein But2 C-terminal domain-containing protein n=1 Tax=Cochliobolus carbonum (strain 26-R-13) TaxID=930089 RepID=W6YKM8_COCC2|nr:uncharacterized protein COCCADRAFT_1068 [Bipolaris zeicola 26-R-13]EUC38270.1 hypothetical protein COCCADRAFT_1068 [Bipolaris zeicola 26-R-13]
MKFSTSVLFASTMALASASTIFSIVPVSGSSPIEMQNITAYDNGLAIGPKQDASCGVPDINFASFFLSNDTNNDVNSLYLYTDLPPRRAFVDLSEFGNSRIRFYSGVDPKPDENFKLAQFLVKDDDLFIVDHSPVGVRALGFQACPLHNGEGFSVNVDNPEFPASPSCIKFSAKISYQPEPVKCLYNDIHL